MWADLLWLRGCAALRQVFLSKVGGSAAVRPRGQGDCANETWANDCYDLQPVGMGKGGGGSELPSHRSEGSGVRGGSEGWQGGRGGRSSGAETGEGHILVQGGLAPYCI